MLLTGTLATARVSALLLTILALSCAPKNQVNRRLDAQMPKKIVWAWERPEDLRFLDPNEFGIAFLAQTIFLENDRVVPNMRRQPLEISPGTYLIAVSRIETNKEGGKRPTFDAETADKTAVLIRNTLDLPDIKAVQVDFDAASSERAFYRTLVNKLKKQFSPETPLTMTSLASWCTGDAWFNDFPVDEAVPMLFRMGADDEKIRTYLRNGNEWREPLCRGSYGVSVDDRIVAGIQPDRRLYYFKNSSWSPTDLARIR